MPNSHSADAPASPEAAGLSPTPTEGLSDRGVAPADIGISGSDPNANALNTNADAAHARQLSGEPGAQNPEFEDGT